MRLQDSIRRILAINMMRLKEERIQNAKIGNIFYDIPDVEHIIAT
jgi:hypothetical protein